MPTHLGSGGERESVGGGRACRLAMGLGLRRLRRRWRSWGTYW